MASEDLESISHMDYLHTALMLLFCPFRSLKALVHMHYNCTEKSRLYIILLRSAEERNSTGLEGHGMYF